MVDEPRSGGDESLAIRAAWLHYAGGMTQADVAKKLGITGVKAHRLISRVNQSGAVKVTIDGDIAECVALEGQLAECYGLSYCEVAPDLHESGLPLRAVGATGAKFLKREIENRKNKLIGFGHGRTLAAVVRQLPHMGAANTQFVSLLGGLTRNYAANPHDVMHRLADRTGAAAYFMPVPFLANTVEDREVLLAQRGVRDVFEMAKHTDLNLVGVGTTKPVASLVATGMIDKEEIAEVESAGGVGELLGHFFNKDGEAIETGLTARTLTGHTSGSEVVNNVAIAGGEEKVGAIRSVLKSGRLNGLITDERTATALVNHAST